VRDLVYNRSVKPGNAITVGFAGTHASKARPDRFTVNGVSCRTLTAS
jgi:hypothetical protein